MINNKIVRIVLILSACLAALNALALENKSKCKIKYTLSRTELGSRSNPVRCDTEEGEWNYLDRLRDTSGKPVQYRRIGHTISHDSRDRILDRFEIKSHDGSVCVEIYMDMYWKRHIENKAIKGFEIIGPKKPPPIEYRYDAPPLTARDVYQMIIDNGYYCEILNGSAFHDEGLKGIKRPPNGRFPLRRIIFAGERGNGIIETRSEINPGSIRKPDDDIRLCWYSCMESCTFEEAVNMVEKLGRIKKGGFKTWRIPTLKELFSIVKKTPGNHFPRAFEFPKDQDLIFWTSTPVKKEGTALDYDKKRKAYFVVQRRFSKKSGEYSLIFSLQNVEGKKKEKAYLLPVFSEIMYAHRTTRIQAPPKPGPQQPGVSHSGSSAVKVNQSPGLVTPRKTPPVSTPTAQVKKPVAGGDKIPGFDDVPDPSKQAQPQTITPPQSQTSQAATPPKPVQPRGDKIPGFDDVPDIKKSKKAVNITLFPYMWKGMFGPAKESFLNDLNDEIKQSLEVLDQEIKKDFNLSLIIDKKDSSDPQNSIDITRLYSLLTEQKIGDSEKLNRIKSQIMDPKNIDIIVTVEQKDPTVSDLKFQTPIIINGIDNKIYKKNIIHMDSKYDSLINHISDDIRKIIQNNFTKIR